MALKFPGGAPSDDEAWSERWRRWLGDLGEWLNSQNENTAHTLAASATTFKAASNLMTITGDGGGNTIATITEGDNGQFLTLIFVDGNVTITDTAGHTTNTIDLSAAFTSADDTVLQLVFDNTSWYEVSRSVN